MTVQKLEYSSTVGERCTQISHLHCSGRLKCFLLYLGGVILWHSAQGWMGMATIPLTCHQKVTSRKVKGLFLSFADFHHFILLLGFFFSFICEPYDLVELFHLYLPSSKFFAHLLCLDHRTDVQYLYHAAKHASHRRIWSIISNIQIKKIALRQMRLTSLP